MRNRKESALYLQAIWRGRMIRKKLDKFKNVIVRLQALYRGRSSRKKFKEYKDNAIEEANRAKLQAARQYRIDQNQKELNFLKHTPADLLPIILRNRQISCVKHIQRWWRKKLNLKSKNYQESLIETKKKGRNENNLNFLLYDKTERNNKTNSETSSSETSSSESSFEEDEKNIKIKRIAEKRQQYQDNIHRLIKRRVQEKEREWKEKNCFSSDRTSIRLRKKLAHLSELRQICFDKLNDYQFSSREQKRKELEERTKDSFKRCEKLIKRLKNPIKLDEIKNNKGGSTLKQNNFFLPCSIEKRRKAAENHLKTKSALADSKKWWNVYIAGSSLDIRSIVNPEKNSSYSWDDVFANKMASIWWSAFTRRTTKSNNEEFLKDALKPPSLHELECEFRTKKLSSNSKACDELFKKIDKEARIKAKKILNELIPSSTESLSFLNLDSESNKNFSPQLVNAQEILNTSFGFQERDNGEKLQADSLIQNGKELNNEKSNENGRDSKVLNSSECLKNEIISSLSLNELKEASSSFSG